MFDMDVPIMLTTGGASNWMSYGMPPAKQGR